MFIEPHRCHYLWELLGHCRSGWVGGLHLYIASEIAKDHDGASGVRQALAEFRLHVLLR